jgi:hypothetical protein
MALEVRFGHGARPRTNLIIRMITAITRSRWLKAIWQINPSAQSMSKATKIAQNIKLSPLEAAILAGTRPSKSFVLRGVEVRSSLECNNASRFSCAHQDAALAGLETFGLVNSRMCRRECGPNWNRRLDYENSSVHFGRSCPACQPIHSEDSHDDLRRNERD